MLKRSPLARRTPLRSGSQLARAPMRRRPRRARPEFDDARYLAWVRRQPCCAPGCTRRAPSDPHHRPGAGVGARSHDHEAIPLCRADHDDVDRFAGRFRGWTRAQRQAWHTAQVAVHRARHGEESTI
jgi:hypothetical protein